MKRVLSVLIAAVLAFGLMSGIAIAETAGAFAGGSGTADDPYLISTKYHLDNVRNHMDACYKMINDVVFTEADFKKGGDFYNDGTGFLPIRNNDESMYGGIFDGGGYWIRNLYMNVETDEDAMVALFEGNSGDIKNLGVSGSFTVRTTRRYTEGGGIVGHVVAGGIASRQRGQVKNCSSNCKITVKAANEVLVGGIAGSQEGFADNCKNYGEIVVESTGDIARGNCVGGIAGKNTGGIFSCYNKGEISAKSSEFGIVVGGIAGSSNGQIYDSFNVAKITGRIGRPVMVGGICGYISGGSIVRCFNDGEIVAKTTDEIYQSGAAAGIVAEVEERSSGCKIEKCYNEGRIVADSGADEAAGIAVYNYAKISDCYNIGPITGRVRAAGIAVWNSHTVGKINNCYNVGRISAAEQWGSVAGIACINHGEITSCYYSDTVSIGVDTGTDTATKCTETQLKTQSTFSGFDYATVWKFDTAIQPYPILREAHYHTFGKYVFDKNATEKYDGTKTRTCTGCGYSETVTAVGTRWKNPFKDVKTKDFYYVPVLWAVNNGITAGTSRTTFAPGEACTRGQIATFLWRAAGQPAAKGTNPFIDVKKSDYYYKAVLWAVSKGITSGTSKTAFAPNEPCTRGQIATFLWRAAGQPAAKGTNPFTDVKKSDYYYKAVLWAVDSGITAGTSKTNFSPASPCTRGQIATFLYRYYK